jgi:hypothetical protein
MNLNKFSKAELISKLNGLKSNKNDSEPSFLQKTLEYLFLFKTFLLKITLLTIIIKVFKKYSIFRRIWAIFNTILFTIFGISLIDFYEIEAISKVFHNIIDIYSNFYNNLSELFVKKPNIPVEIPSRMNGIQSKTIGIQEGNENSDRIIERFKKIINKPEEIPVQEEIPVVEKPTPFYENKYVIIGGMLVLSCLAWYFYDDMKPLGSAVLGWINSHRSKPEPGKDNSTSSNTTSSNTNIQSLKDWLQEKFNKKGDGSNSAESRGRKIDFDRIGITKPEVVNKDDSYIEILKGLTPITGDRNNFAEEGSAIAGEMSAFITYERSNEFPNQKFREVLFDITRQRFFKLVDANQDLYPILLENRLIKDSINDFFALQDDVFLDLQENKQQENKQEEIIIEGIKSPTYDDILLATIEEQDHWSDKALSPKQDLLSPLKMPKSILSDKRTSKIDEILNKADFSEVDEKFKTVKNVHWEEDLDDYFPKAEEVGVAFKEVKDLKGKSKLVETEIITDEDGVFAEITVNKTQDSIQPVNNERKSLFDMIKARINDKDVVSSPNIGNSNIPSTSNITNVGNIKPVAAQPTISNLLESFNDLYEDTGIDIEDNSNIQQGESSNTKIEDIKSNKPDISNLLKDIRSKRLEYGSPSKIDKDLPKANIEEYSEDQDQDEEEEIGPINWKEEIKFEINRGDIKDRFIDFNFGDKFKDLNKVYIFLNDGSAQYIDVHANKDAIQSIKWDNKGISNPDYKELDIFKIYIMDNIKPKLSQEIYANPNVKILKSFHENRVGRNY